jgi:beta-glucosidase
MAAHKRTANPPPDLPRDFTWGVSTSSYQIEGAVQEDGRGESIWDVYCRTPGNIANGDTGAIACDHYHRYKDDVRLIRKLGAGAYRFSVAWPRVMPAGRGAVNEAGLAFYDRLIDAVLGAGVEPWLCLYHWDLPQALQDQGGWTNRDCAGWFDDYAGLIARRYGDRVKRFATFNEPCVFTLFGFLLGGSAPGIRDHQSLLRAIHHVNLAHGAAVGRLRDGVKDASIGAIHNCQPCRPAADDPKNLPQNRAAAQVLDAYWNGAFPEPQLRGVYPALIEAEITRYVQPGDMAAINRPVDWFGLNHYSPHYVLAAPEKPLGFAFGPAPEGTRKSVMDWPIDPDAFAHTISIVHRKYGLPVYVLENGTANHDAIAADGSVSDPSRIDYLRAYTDAMFKVMADGVDVRGYFVWSLLDNFEWASGLKMRFGLVYVDYPTQRRIPKTSFGWYADLIQRAASRKKASGTTARKKAAAPSKAARSKRKRTKTAASKPEASKKAKMANAKTKARPVKSKRAKRSRMNDARAKTARSNLRSRTTGRR